MRLRIAREKRGLVQQDAAAGISWMSQDKLSDIENGERRVDIFELFDIAKLYKVSYQDLIVPPTVEEYLAVGDSPPKPEH